MRETFRSLGIMRIRKERVNCESSIKTPSDRGIMRSIVIINSILELNA